MVGKRGFKALLIFFSFGMYRVSWCLLSFSFLAVQIVSVVVMVGAGGLCLTGDNHCLKSTNTTMTLGLLAILHPGICTRVIKFCSDRCI